MLNVFIGFEQSNKYTISKLSFYQEFKGLVSMFQLGGADGEPLGYIAEEPKGFWGTLSRQAFSTHRPFRAVIMDKEGVPVLWGCLLSALFTEFLYNLMFIIPTTGTTTVCVDKLEDVCPTS